MSRITHRRRPERWPPAARRRAGGCCPSPAARATTRTHRHAAAAGTDGADAGGDNDDPGEKVVIGFSGPAADHGWLAAINSPRRPRPKKYADVELKTAEGTNDANLQISQVETFINDKVDAIVLLPTDGAALTDVAHQGDGGRHPGHQRRPRVLQPVRRAHHDPRRQLRHGRLGRHLRLQADRGQGPRTRSSPRSPASTRCR